MAGDAKHLLSNYLHQLSASARMEQLPDRTLIERFVSRRDDDAFAVLVRRHGPMVLRVCQCVLCDSHDAEDVFQAVFLVLSRKAASLRRLDSVGCFLHGVAYRLAQKARAQILRQRKHAGRIGSEQHVEDPLAEVSVREAQAILHEELARLPEKFRVPLVLCCLEGKTRDEAARQLGWSTSLVKSRLGQGRQRLRDRLIRRGLTQSAALASALFVEQSAPAAVPALLVRSTMQAVQSGSINGVSASIARLAESSLRSTGIIRAKVAVGLLLLTSALAAGVGAFLPSRGRERAVEPLAHARSSDASRRDRFGDPLPPGAVARIGTVRWWHGRKHDVNDHFSFTYTADGKNLALCEDGKAVRILNAETGQEIRRIEPTLAPEVLQRISESGFHDLVTCFALAPDGKRLVTGCCWRPPLRVWDVATGKEQLQIPGDKSGTTVLAFSPDSKIIAASSAEIRLLDAATGKEIRRITDKRASNCSHGLVFSGDGKTLISANGCNLRLWDVGTGRLLRTLGLASPEKGPAFTQPVVSPDGQRLAAWCSQDALYLWNAAGSETIRRIKLGSSMPLYCFSPDGRILACNVRGNRKNETVLFDSDTGRELRRWDEDDVFEPTHMTFSPDGEVLAQVRDGVIRLREAASGRLLQTTPSLPSGVTHLQFLPDGKTLRLSFLAGRNGSWDWLSGKPLATFRNRPKEFVPGWMDAWQRPELTADGSKAALVDAEGFLHVWETATGKACCRIGPRIPSGVRADFVFSADGKILALGGSGNLRLYVTASGKLLRSFPVAPHHVRPIAFSPDGRILAVYYCSTTGLSEPSVIRLWDTTTGKEQSRLAWPGDKDRPADKDKPPAHLLFTADGKRLIGSFDPGPQWSEEEASWRIGVCVWDLSSGRELRRINGSAGPIALSPDERTLAAAEGKTIFLWELASGKERGRFRGHRERIESLAFSPNARLLASGSLDHTACVWDATGICPDGQWHLRPATQDQLERWWHDLAGKDGVRAYRAVWRFAAAGSSAVTFLSQRLRPEPRGEEERLAHLVADLDSDRFETRERAVRELRHLGEKAEPALRKALAAKPSPEASRRMRALLDRLELRTVPAEQLRTLRAVELLEQMGSAEARALLRSLAAGAPFARLTREAKAALDRCCR